MRAATDAVCLAMSDDEDYVSFDEAEIDQGIQELYSDDSASDAGSDMSHPDMNFDDLNEEPLVDRLLSSSNANANGSGNSSALTNDNLSRLNAATSAAARDDAFALLSFSNSDASADANANANAAPGAASASAPKSSSASGFGFMNSLFGGGGANAPGAAPAPASLARRANQNGNGAPLRKTGKKQKRRAKRGAKGKARNRNRRQSSEHALDDLFGAGVEVADEDEDDSESSGSGSPALAAHQHHQHQQHQQQRQQRGGRAAKVTKLEKRLRRLSALKHKKDARRVRKGRKVVHRQKVNTNVMSINLGTLKGDALQVVAGDPIFCANEKCRTVLSMHDALLDKLEKLDKRGRPMPRAASSSPAASGQAAPKAEEMKADTDNGEYLWVCQFCKTVNVVELDDEGERPSKEALDYVIAPPSEAKQSEDDGLIIFCVDVSGSMCVTQEVQGSFKLKGDHVAAQLSEFSAFIDAGDRLNQYLPNQERNVTWVSRLQAVQAAVDEQLEALRKEKPRFKVALVSFADDVVIVGDGVQAPKVVAGDKLADLAALQEIGRAFGVQHAIGDAFDKLSEALWKLKEAGQTALGPALAVSIAMAGSRRGSQVILCTDGLANVGVGALDVPSESAPSGGDDNGGSGSGAGLGARLASALGIQIPNAIPEAAAEQAQAQQAASGQAGAAPEKTEMEKLEEWYENLGFYASEQGVIVNVISITDDGCRLENLGKLTDACNGAIKRINPLKLTEKFSGILGNDVLATRTQATMFLHPGLQFFSSINNAGKAEDAPNGDGTDVNEINDLLNLVDLGVPQAGAQAQPQAQAKPPSSGTSVSTILEAANENDQSATVASAVVAPKKDEEDGKQAAKAAQETPPQTAEAKAVAKATATMATAKTEAADKKGKQESKGDGKDKVKDDGEDEKESKTEEKKEEAIPDLGKDGIETVHHSMQDVGNVFADSELFFEYVVRKARIAEFRHLSHLPFQCHIRYEKMDGTQMLRVLTQLRPVVFDRKKARERVNVDILAKYGTKVTTELCSKGDYESSRAFTQANTVWMQRNINQNNDSNNLDNTSYRAQMIHLANYTNKNMVLDHQMKKQQQTESMSQQQQQMEFAPAMAQMSQPSVANGDNESAFSGFAHFFGSNNNNNGNSGNNNHNNNHNNNNSQRTRSARKAARNDKFSSAMYRMKKK